jgi:hypothetical protein
VISDSKAWWPQGSKLHRETLPGSAAGSFRQRKRVLAIGLAQSFCPSLKKRIMKKYLLSWSALTILAISMPHFSWASNHNTPSRSDSARASLLIARLHEIQAMEKDTLAASQKRELRKEVRVIKRELQQMRGGVYLSVGAIIIIILLLILLL